MLLTRAFPVLVLAIGLTGCQGFGTLGMKKNTDGTGPDTVAKLEATQPAGEKLPEIVALPPASSTAFAPATAYAPTTARAGASGETAAMKAAAWEDEDLVMPPKRKPKKAPETSPPGRAKSVSGLHAKTYVVQRGDTLQKISQKFYGTTKSWPKIFDANKAKMKKPDVVIVGMVLSIP